MNRRLAAFASCLALSGLFVAPAFASHWSTSTQVNNVVTNAHFLQQNSVAVSDGDGGVIVAWQDLRNELYYYIYAQRINANGDPVWTADGVLLSTAGANQQLPQIVSDGAGGAIVVWVDQRTDTGDLYAQRISAAGAVLWTPTGVPIAVAANVQSLQKGIADGAGGAIFAWTDTRANSDIYAQRINANGTVQWTANGVVVSATPQTQVRATLATDRAQGAFIAWEDHRNDPTFSDVYAQRVRADGSRAWTTNGVPVAVLPWHQRNPVVAYGVGTSAYIVWEDSRGAGTDFHIYYQRLFSSGAPAFVLNGVKVSSLAGGDHFNPQVADASSSVTPAGNTQYIVWEHVTAGGDQELMLNEVYTGGFVANEVEISFGDGDKLDPHVTTSEVENGIVISWTSDKHYGPGASNIFFTKYYGGFKLDPSGYPVCAADGVQGPAHVISDSQGGVILVWDDWRDGVADSDIRAQRMDFTGSTGYASADITSIVDHPQDQGLRAIVSWTPSEFDAFPYTFEKHYSVWRRFMNPGSSIAPAPQDATHGTVLQDERLAQAVAAGVSRELAAQQLATGWELAGTSPAVNLPSYALTAATYGDSTGPGAPRTGFMVIFETELGNWFSASDSAYSLDNTAPAAPLELIGSTAGTHAQLDWMHPDASPDVTGYHVYRSPVPGVPVSPANRIGTVEDLSHLDLTTGGVTHYYVVTAIDDATLEGPPSNEVAAPIGVTGVDIEVPRALSLRSARGNPLRGPAIFHYGLPTDSEVSILVCDITGRQVREAQMGRVPAGWHEYRLDGKDAMGRGLATGTYFLRLTAGAESRILKFVMLR